MLCKCRAPALSASFHNYPITVTNALGQRTLAQYDYRFGQPTVVIEVSNYGEIAAGTQRITTTHYYANGQRVAMRTAAGVTYVHSDHLRSTNVTSGAQTGNIKYFPYGATRSGSVSTAYKFTGQRLDDSIGLFEPGSTFPALAPALCIVWNHRPTS